MVLILHSLVRRLTWSLFPRIVARRAGDVASCYATPSKAEKELGWRAERTVEDCCE